MFRLVVTESVLHVSPRTQYASPPQDSREVSTEERDSFISDIATAMEAGSVLIRDHFLRLSCKAIASSAGEVLCTVVWHCDFDLP